MTVQRSRQFTVEGDPHKVYKEGDSVYVDHLGKDGGKNDVINLTRTSGAKTVRDGVKVVRDYHYGDGPSYYEK